MAKAWKVNGISPKKSLEHCATAIIQTRFREMMSYKEGAIEGKEIKYVHDMRVSSRRLRAALRSFADCFTPKKEFRRRLKAVENITRTMGGVRDMDVLIDLFQKELKTLTDEEQIGVNQLIDHLKKVREQNRQPMIKMFKSLESGNFEKDFMEFFGG